MKRVLKRPIVWAPILIWFTLTVLGHHLIPMTPTYRFDLAAANREIDRRSEPEARASDSWYVAEVSPDGDSLVYSPRIVIPDFLFEPADGVGPRRPRRKSEDSARHWNVKSGAMTLVERLDDENYFSANRWRAITTESASTFTTRTYFVHLDSRRVTPTYGDSFVQSHTGRLVAFHDGKATHLLDLETQQTRKSFVRPTVEQEVLASFEPRCFSRDGHTVEHWPIPPGSWFTSALWAGGATIVLAVPIVLWRYWRGRKRATISPTPPPTAPEV